MDLDFRIGGKVPGEEPANPKLGIIEGYIQEGINQVSLIELISITNAYATKCQHVLVGIIELKDGSEKKCILPFFEFYFPGKHCICFVPPVANRGELRLNAADPCSSLSVRRIGKRCFPPFLPGFAFSRMFTNNNCLQTPDQKSSYDLRALS